jgi:transposase
MARPSGTKNIMRSPEEKEEWVIKYLNGEIGFRPGAKIIGVGQSVFRRWINNYKRYGVEGLKSKTGKCSRKGSTGRPKKVKTREEELERENLKLRIEIERLKKGYYVKGVGRRKEYISINNRSSESLKN